MKKKDTKILVAMSGGVDSSIAAALLVRKGYNVTGAFMKQWSDSPDVHGVCSWKKDRRDAVRVAAHLGIPFITLDFEKEYKEWVMDYMFKEYEVGRTPNPDVMCNKFIKFGVWLNKARDLGFDYLATGHYARTKKGKLLKAKDKEKDQTYFLHQLTKEQLLHTLFPVGKYIKKRVRKLAKKYNIPTADRPESMGICFVGEVPMKDFLQQKIKKNPGDIVFEDGTILGRHEGLPFYTIGQRNVGVQAPVQNVLARQNSSIRAHGENVENKPLYVLKKDFDHNRLVVGYKDSSLLHKDIIELADVHWISGQALNFPLHCKVRLRHRQAFQNAILRGTTLSFSKEQRAVTPGQFAVIYKGGSCLGGGVII